MKTRLDVLLVERGLFPTRAKAQAAVMAGSVLVDGAPETKAGAQVREGASVELLKACPFVSRGGLKLEAALEAFGLQVRGMVCLDLGASTGGFTDCLLQRGASRVYAVDVGHGQLDDRLRKDPRVVSREKTHARDLRPCMFPETPSLAVVDVSFISLTKVLPYALACLAPGGELVALIKPQFEVGPKDAPKGVVRTGQARAKAIELVRACLPGLGLREAGLLESPIKGPKGNAEFLIRLKRA